MKKRMIGILLCLLMCSLACQSTPSVEVVVPKDQETMLGKAGEQQTETEQKPEYPAREQYTYRDDNFTVTIDADVIVPNAPMPVLKVAENGYTDEQVKNLFDVFFDGEEAYWIQQIMPTKSEIEEQLKMLYANLESGAYLEWDWTEEEYRDLIANVEEEYKHAPETRTEERRRADGTMDKSNQQGQTYDILECSSELNGHVMWVNSDPAGTSDFGSTLFVHKSEEHYPPYNDMNLKRIDETSELPSALHITLADAIAQAEQVIRVIGEPFTLHSAFLIDDEQFGFVDDLVSPPEYYAIKLYYAKTRNGVPFGFEAGSTMQTDNIYSLPWKSEYIVIVVDNNGMESFSWNSPLTVKETLVEDSKLLPYEQINETAQKMLPIIYGQRGAAWNDPNKKYPVDVRIDCVALELMRIREQEVTNTRTGLAIPVWVYYGTVRMEGEYEVEYLNFGTSGASSAPEYTALLCLNAVDGSVINPLLGY